jgi:hypothetical protein
VASGVGQKDRPAPVTVRFLSRILACSAPPGGGGFWALPGEDAKRPRMGAAVVLGQDLAEVAGPVGDCAVADLAACDRKMGDRDGEAAGL